MKQAVEYALGNKGFCFWQGKKSENVVFLFLTLEFAAFFFSDSWYCQIQTTRLIMFFGQNMKISLLVNLFLCTERMKSKQ